jgi:tetratricopeptide (TPR) repeat protein
MAKLSNAAQDVQEIIGTGIIDALKTLGKDNSVETLVKNMKDVAFYIADVIRGISVLIKKIGEIPILGDALKFLFTSSPLLDYLANLGKITAVQKSSDNQHLKALEDQFKVIKKTGTVTTKLTKEELAKLKAKRLQLAIDKANLALGKSEGIFDIDKIQIAAALANQAQLLGKATEASQVLQIANDTARLNVKRSMLALEEAIASKDEAAIIAATAKLNEDLKILGALSNQKTQMVAIESILKGLVPKDLINQNNLDEALRKIKEMLALLAQVKTPTITTPSGGGGGGGGGGGFIQTPNGIRPTTEPRSIAEINKATEALGGVISVIGENGKEFTKLVDGLPPVFQTVEDAGAFNALVNSFANGAMNPFNAGSFRAAEGGSLFNSGAVGSRDRDININVQTGIGDPEAIARAIEDAIRQANQRGTTSLSIL